jgi:hypothetical protein
MKPSIGESLAAKVRAVWWLWLAARWVGRRREG